MTEMANKTIARQFYEQAWNVKDVAIVEELLAHDFVNHEIEGDVTQPHRELYKQAVLETFAAFPDWTTTIDDLIAEGDKVVMQWRAQGTHTGEGMGTPTGKQIALNGITIVRVKDRKISDFWKKDNSFLAWKLLVESR
ncbi:MAG TPA: ester cyclase [Ktedonobacteraceae bacterium]|nr:ester cyclase [Ktedonobacteraceae bacterium]